MQEPSTDKQPYKSFGGHGIDIAIKRADDLDKFLCEHLSTKINSQVLDLGCGAGGHSIRMAKAGAAVTAIDLHDFSEEFNQHRHDGKISEDQLKFICGDVTKLPELIFGKKFSDVYMQRTLHYLTYKQSLELLQFLHQITEDKLFISVTGITSAIGADYIGNGVSVRERFFSLKPDCAKVFSIHEPVCLYSRDEFMMLLEESGWQVDRCRQSAFGNIRAICSR